MRPQRAPIADCSAQPSPELTVGSASRRQSRVLGRAHQHTIAPRYNLSSNSYVVLHTHTYALSSWTHGGARDTLRRDGCVKHDAAAGWLAGPGLAHSRDVRPSLVRTKCCIRPGWLFYTQHELVTLSRRAFFVVVVVVIRCRRCRASTHIYQNTHTYLAGLASLHPHIAGHAACCVSRSSSPHISLAVLVESQVE